MGEFDLGQASNWNKIKTKLKIKQKCLVNDFIERSSCQEPSSVNNSDNQIKSNNGKVLSVSIESSTQNKDFFA